MCDQIKMDACPSSRLDKNLSAEVTHAIQGNDTTRETAEGTSMRDGMFCEKNARQDSTLGQYEVDKRGSNIFRHRKEVCNEGGTSSSWLSRTLCTQPSLEDVVENPSSGQLDSRSDVETYERSCSRQYRRDDYHYHMPSRFTFEIDEVIEDQIEVRPTVESVNRCQEHDYCQDIYETSINYDDAGVSVILHGDDKCTVISNFLEGNGYMCSGLEKWYDSEESGFVAEDDEEECDTPRNRSCNIENRRRRIERLQINLTPFEVDDVIFMKGSINSARYSPVELQSRARSFSAGSPTSVANKKQLTDSYSCYNYNSLPSCGNSRARSAALVDWDENEDEDLCYDSDPSDFVPPIRKNKTKPKRSKGGSKLRSASFGDETMPSILSSKTLLIWHRSASRYIVGMTMNPPTIAVRAWIEQGSYIQGGLIQPKLMWQETYGKETRTPDGSRSILNTMSFHSIELLDISKVIPLVHVDRQLYPFAKKSCCFVVQAYDKEMVFEAETIEQRNEIIHGLKLLVSRLGSKIIVGDRDVLHEFFSPIGSVPGEAPAILTEGTIDI